MRLMGTIDSLVPCGDLGYYRVLLVCDCFAFMDSLWTCPLDFMDCLWTDSICLTRFLQAGTQATWGRLELWYLGGDPLRPGSVVVLCCLYFLCYDLHHYSAYG